MPRLSKDYVPLLKSYIDSRKLGPSSLLCEVLFLRLLAASDDLGRFLADPFTLGSRLLTARMASGTVTVEDVAAALVEMSERGLVELYEVDGEPFVALIDADKRLRADREPRLRYPAPEDGHPWAPVGAERSHWAPPVPSRARARAPAKPEPEPTKNQNQNQPPRAGARESSGSGKPRRRSRTPDTVHHRFLDWWCQTWQKLRGVEYAVQAKDAAAVKAIRKLAHEDEEEMRRRAETMLSIPDQWTQQNASLSLLHSRWNQYAGKVNPAAIREARKREDRMAWLSEVEIVPERPKENP